MVTDGDAYMTKSFRENYLGPKGTKRLVIECNQRMLKKFIAEGKNESFICQTLKICEACYKRHHSEMTTKKNSRIFVHVNEKRNMFEKKTVLISISGRRKYWHSARGKQAGNVEYRECACWI